jgi:hypothetical protein
MKTCKNTLLCLLAIGLVGAGFDRPSHAQAQNKPQPDATEQLIAHAAAAAVSASNGNGAANTHANLQRAGFAHLESSFLPRNKVGPGLISYMLVWNDNTLIIAFRGLSENVHKDLFWDSREHRKGLSKILGKSGFYVQVPKRFYESFESALPTIEQDLQTAGAGGRNVGRRRLIVTGHSMGGLWSHYLTMALLEKGRRVDTTITFGTPYVARADFQRYLESLAKQKGTRLLAVENHFDSGIRRWMEKNSFEAHTTPAEYQNRIGAPVPYAFRANEHDMAAYFNVARFRAAATADPQRFIKVDGTRTTVFPVVAANDSNNRRPERGRGRDRGIGGPQLIPVVDASNGDKVQIQLYNLPDSGTWWKALKVIDIHNKAYLLESENGKFINAQDKSKPGELWLPRGSLEDRLRIEFWKAKELGIHRHVHSFDVNLVTRGRNRIAIWW